ncbi:MAG: FAD-dependent oxidoreductase, partial [Thermoproteota archaeon]|nr:FAD-dependent oxidoreductase [Thermoproteota archaeon]
PVLFSTEGRFVGEKRIEVIGGQTIAAPKILIATGTRPAIPKINGLKESNYITSDQALRLEKQPKTLTIIGGGYIAAELAHFFGSLGSTINIVQLKEFLIPNEDVDISKKFTELFSRKYNVFLGYNTESIAKKNGFYDVIARKNNTGKSVEIVSDQLLIATGRIPNSDTLDLAKSRVKTNQEGFIEVDEKLETNVKGIFALGDAVGKYQFRHSANWEAQYAFNNIMATMNEEKISVDYSAMPHAIFSSPQIAAVGYTEQELKIIEAQEGRKIDYAKSIYPFINTAMGQAIEDREGFVKFLVERSTRRILGCHIIGTNASVLIHEVLVAMRAGRGERGSNDTLGNILRTVHIHPALSEVISRAASSIFD